MEHQKEEKRTNQQNRALHKLFNDISNYCVETGLDQKVLVNALPSYAIPVSPQSIKEIWRVIQYTLTGKTSTKDLNKKEIDQVYEVFNKFISEVTHEHFAFPSLEQIFLMQLDNEKYGI